MPEEITITVTLEQAEAVVDAANCASLAAEGEDLSGSFIPVGKPETRAADDHIRRKAELAQEVSAMLRPEIQNAEKRDPDLQDFLHWLKTRRKHGSEN